MNSRQKYELRLLVENGSFEIADLASAFSVSERSIRYDVEGLQEDLRRLGASADVLIVRQGVVSLHALSARWMLLSLSSITANDFYASPLTSRQRVLLIICDLCWATDYVTVQSLADKYAVSRNTVTRDMPEVRAYLEKNGARVVAHRGRGLRLEAGETERRLCLSRAIREFASLDGGQDILNADDYSQWFPPEEFAAIKRIVREAEDQSMLYLDDTSFEAIVIHIELSLERYRENPANEVPVMGDEVPKGSLQYRMSEQIVRQVNEEFHVSLPASEIYYIGLHIGVRSSEAMAQTNAPNAALEFVCLDLINSVSRRMEVDLTHDSRLYESLLQHVNASMYRRRAGVMLKNPLRNELVAEYGTLLDVIRSEVRQSELAQLIDTSDDELSYILLHFAVALRRYASSSTTRPNVVVVCATGIGTAELLAAGLQNHFDFNIVGTMPRHRVQGARSLPGVDLIISTVPLETGIPHIEVSPLLKASDQERISVKLGELGLGGIRTAAEGEASHAAADLMGIVRRHAAPGGEAELFAAIRAYLDLQRTEQKGSYMLSELIEGHMALGVECANWEEAVRASGAPLIQSGDITEEYVNAVISNVKEMGPYVVITKHIALPHATNKVGVNRTSMSFVRLLTPVEFGNPANDPVKYLFMLATVDATSHLVALQSLAELLSEPGFVSLLETAQTTDQILDHIKSFEKEEAAEGGER